MLDMTSRRSVAREGRGFFGVACYRPKTASNVGSLWRSARLFDAAFLATVGHRYTRQPSDTEESPRHTPLLHFTDIDDLMAHLPDACPLVGVELDARAEPLATFTHPVRALYLLGAEDDGLPPKVLNRCHHIVRISTAQPRSMNVACAGSIVLHDRHSKSAW